MINIFGDATADLESSLRFRAARQVVLASNIANADTPGYRAMDLDFPAKLQRQQMALERTHETHLPQGAHGREYGVVTGPAGEGPDRNGVNLETELVRMSRNAGYYSDHADILSRMLGLARSAISGEG